MSEIEEKYEELKQLCEWFSENKEAMQSADINGIMISVVRGDYMTACVGGADTVLEGMLRIIGSKLVEEQREYERCCAIQ